MMKKILNVLFGALLTFTLFLTSCSDDASIFTTEDTENFVDQSVFAVQAQANAGKMGCFEFIFPINILFPDGSSSEVADYETMRSALKAWYEANAEELGLPTGEDRGRGNRPDIDPSLLPSLDFPVEVVSAEGETISIADRDALKELKKSCRKDFYGGRGHHGHRRGDKCFKLVFPVTIAFPDTTTAEVADRKELKQTIRTWKDANPDSEDRPSLAFPVTVELEDETQQEVASKEDLQALKESCSN
tara:strand:+ start:9378 stop:10115 length:738 start_codon:yes stop_codon:yes gene_type:complete